jgi:glycosyltransferase involved in cell wall biosynthesis
MLNLLCRDQAIICASVRGNLYETYRLTYGPLGVPLAIGHLTSLRGMDHVVAMTSAMALQVARYTGRTPAVISNFVDESPLESFRDTAERKGPLRIVSLARLESVKQPHLLIDALVELRGGGVDVRLDIDGEGSLRPAIEARVRERGLGDVVTMHGHLPSPYAVLARADAMVLPSISEGMSRAALEALHLGVPCVLRDADGNAELVQEGVNGALFQRDSDLAAALLAAARGGRAMRERTSLLPASCRQEVTSRRYLELVELT